MLLRVLREGELWRGVLVLFDGDAAERLREPMEELAVRLATPPEEPSPAAPEGTVQ